MLPLPRCSLRRLFAFPPLCLLYRPRALDLPRNIFFCTKCTSVPMLRDIQAKHASGEIGSNAADVLYLRRGHCCTCCRWRNGVDVWRQSTYMQRQVASFAPHHSRPACLVSCVSHDSARPSARLRFALLGAAFGPPAFCVTRRGLRPRPKGQFMDVDLSTKR